MSNIVEHPVRAAPAILTRLRELADTMGTQELTTHAVSLGVLPPDDRPDWAVVLEYAPDMTERGLFWVDPDDQ